MSAEEYRRLYPDLLEKGGIVNAVKILLAQSPTVAVNGWGSNYAHIQCEKRSGQISIRAEERQFRFDLWQEGTVLADGEHTDFERVVQIIKDWVTSTKNAEDFERETGLVKARANHPKPTAKPGAYLANGNSLEKI